MSPAWIRLVQLEEIKTCFKTFSFFFSTSKKFGKKWNRQKVCFISWLRKKCGMHFFETSFLKWTRKNNFKMHYCYWYNGRSLQVRICKQLSSGFPIHNVPFFSELNIFQVNFPLNFLYLQEMAYCSGSTSHVKQKLNSLLFLVALRDSVRSQAKIVVVVRKTFGTTIKLHLGWAA